MDKEIELYNRHGPTVLDGMSLVAMGFGQFGVAAGLGYTSTIWTVKQSIDESKPDGLINIGTSLGQAMFKSPKIRMAFGIAQFVYDLAVSGTFDNAQNDSNFMGSDKTNVSLSRPSNVTVSLQQSVSYDLGWETSLSPQEMWDSMQQRKNEEENKKKNQ